MSRATLLLACACALLAGCGGRAGGDWRADLGRPSPNAVLATPAPPLALPATLALPPPA